MAPAAKIHDGRAEGLDERRARVGETHDAAPVAQSLVEGAPQNKPRVLDGVMVVHPSIALRLYHEIHARVVGEKVQEMVQEPYPRRDLGLAFAIELDFDPDECLARLALRTTLTRHLPPVSLEPLAF